MAVYFDDLLDEDEIDADEQECEILVDMKKLVEEMDEVESEYEDEEDEEEDLSF